MEIPSVNSECVDVDTSAKNRVTINVGGVRHETFLSTLANIPDTRLSWLSESSAAFYDAEKKEYFFDRHPGVFSQVLNFYRTGKLHCPTDICGPMFEEELNFWGIDEKQMEPCCWANYTQHREAELNLKAFVGPGFEDLKEEENDDQDSTSSTDRLSRYWQRIRPKMWRFLDEPYSSKRARYVSYISCLFIAVSVITFCATTIPGVRDSGRLIGTNERHSVLTEIEMVCTIFFTFEFVVRLILCPSKMHFVKQPMNWIDFMSIWPFFVYYLTGIQQFQMFLVVRVLRLFRFVKLSYGLQIMIQTLRASVQELFLLLLILLIPVVMFSSIMYYVENFSHGNNPKFDSIPASIWWCLITMTTVGYGDISPWSWGGKIVGGMVAICGILIVALPISVIGSNFSLFYAHAQARLKLPVKQRRLVLGGVPGLMSKHHELSSRRIVKKRATIFEHDNQLDMETNWLSSEKVFGISEEVEMSETGTDNERDYEKQAARTPLLSPNTAANRKLQLQGGGVFSDGELNKLNKYHTRRPRRSGLLPLNKLKDEANRRKDSETNSELADGLPTCLVEDPLKRSFSKEDDSNKRLSQDTIATVSPPSSPIPGRKTSLESLNGKGSRTGSSRSSVPGQKKAELDVCSLDGIDIPKIHFTDNTDNKSWTDSPTSISGSVTLARPEEVTLVTSTNSLENLHPELIANSLSLWRRKSISDSQLCKVFANMDDTKQNLLPNEEKRPKSRVKRIPKQKLVLPTSRSGSANGQVCPHNRERVLSNGNCLRELNGDRRMHGRSRTVSQPCDVSECAKDRQRTRSDAMVDDFLETNI